MKTLFKGVYSGLGVNTVGSFLSAGVYFSCYEWTKQEITKFAPTFRADGGNFLSTVNHMSSAAFADIGCCVVRVPFEVVKQQLQAGLHNSAFSAFRHIVKNAGPRGLYVGFWSTVLREMPFDALEFASYEYLKANYLKKHNLKELSGLPSVGIGAAAGAVAAAITTPFDTIKTRLMTQETHAYAKPKPKPSPDIVVTESKVHGNPTAIHPSAEPLHTDHVPYKGIGDCFRRMVKEEGPKALFRGVVPRVCWVSLGGAIFFSTYETARRALYGSSHSEVHVDKSNR
jgi:solute carrier family 25 S-adenosylmethionine transporter 26